jgi:hypothetical protein
MAEDLSAGVLSDDLSVRVFATNALNEGAESPPLATVRVIVEGRATIRDDRMLVGDATLRDLIEAFPGKYVAPGVLDFGRFRVTLEQLA